MTYFTNCHTVEDLKKRFKKLAFELHPDNNVNNPDATRKFQDMNAEFKIFYSRVKNIHRNAEGEAYEETRADHMARDNGEEFMKIFYSLMKLSSLTLEICGSWIWITGDTYHNKEELKKLGCRFSPSHKAWYWSGEEFNKKHRKATPMEAIRNKYGSEITISAGHRRLAG